MADIKYTDQTKIERFFEMGGGYVLDFSDRTFRDFVISTVEIDINESKYSANGTSKANRMRTFFKNESNDKVSKVIIELAIYKRDHPKYKENLDCDLYEQCILIADDLKSDLSDHAEAIQPNEHDVNFFALAKSIRDAINRNEVQGILDRLHTFLMKYFRNLLVKYSASFEKSTQLQGLCSLYVKNLKDNGKIQSAMTERILKSSISILDAFNNVRNEQSFAHDNTLLNQDEARLIFKNISATVEFIENLEKQINQSSVSAEKEEPQREEDDLPF